MPAQFITSPSGDSMVVLPRDEYERLLAAAAEAAEDAADIRAADEIHARVGRGEEDVFPAAVVDAIIEGASPVKVLREHRGITQDDLAAAAGIDVAGLSQIERGERIGSPAILRGLATALRVEVDLLIGNGA